MPQKPIAPRFGAHTAGQGQQNTNSNGSHPSSDRNPSINSMEPMPRQPAPPHSPPNQTGRPAQAAETSSSTLAQGPRPSPSPSQPRPPPSERSGATDGAGGGSGEAPALLSNSNLAATGSLATRTSGQNDSWCSPQCGPILTTALHGNTSVDSGILSTPMPPPPTVQAKAPPQMTRPQQPQVQQQQRWASSTTAAPRRFAPANIGTKTTARRQSPPASAIDPHSPPPRTPSSSRTTTRPAPPAATSVTAPTTTTAAASTAATRAPSTNAKTAAGTVKAPVPPLNVSAVEQQKTPALPSPYAEDLLTPTRDREPREQELTYEDEVNDIYETFVQHMPLEWAKPILRAVTLQTITGRVPPHLTDSASVFDCLTDLSGEFMVKRDYKLTGGGGGGSPPDAVPAPGRSSPQPPGATTATSPPEGTGATPTPFLADKTIDLITLLANAPSLLRFRLNGVREKRVNEFIAARERAAKEQAERIERERQQGTMGTPPPPIPVPSREVVARALFRPRAGDIQFGAQLCVNEPRLMAPGSRLFLPPTSGTNLASGHSHPHTPSSAAPRQESPAPFAAAATRFPASSAVSFETLPSIFIKAQCEARMAQSNNRGHRSGGGGGGSSSSRRRAIHPFFEREFVATFASGNAASCLFSTTLAPEFLVGLPTFLTHPLRSVASAIRATLHRHCLVVTAEVLRREATLRALRGSEWSSIIHAPPLDLALAYYRDATLYYAGTAGIRGHLFYLAASEGAARLVAPLDMNFDHPEKGLTQLTLGPGSRSPTATAPSMAETAAVSSVMVSQGSGGAQGTYDMPMIYRGQCDAQAFTVAAEWVAQGETSHTAATLKGVSAHRIPPLVPVIARHWTPQRLREKEAMEPLLASTAVLGTTEFWAVMPTGFVSDLLRVLLMLCNAAADFTEYWDRRRDRQTAEEIEAAIQQQTARVTQYLQRLSNVFERSVMDRLIHFYDARFSFYTELDRRNMQTLHQRFDQQLELMARQRMHAEAPQTAGGSGGKSSSQLAPLPPVSQPGSNAIRENANRSRWGNGVSASGQDLAADHDKEDEEEESLLTKPLCDAMAATLSAIAQERAEQVLPTQRHAVAPSAASNRQTFLLAVPTAPYAPHRGNTEVQQEPQQPLEALPPPSSYSVVIITLPDLPRGSK